MFLKVILPMGDSILYFQEFNSALDLEFILLPIQMRFVLSLFTSRPDILPNISKVFKVACKDFRLPSRITVVSSANCVSLICFYRL